MKILLVYPYFLDERIRVEEISAPPIGMYYVAAVLKKNQYDVEILNWHNIHQNPEKIKNVLQEKRPDVIGFSILHANRWGGIEIARVAKEFLPEAKVIFGGIGASFLWEHLLMQFPEIDYVVIGEGEYTLLDVIRYIESEKSRNPEEIKGLAFRKGNRIIKTADADPVENLDELPMPAEYFAYQHVTTSRGCTWKCTFCGSPQFWGGGIRFRRPEQFVRELELLYDKSIRFFYFSDDTFTIDRKRVIAICKRIIEKSLKIGWYAISRVNYVDEEMLYWMRKAGCIQISYGVESGSEKIRRLFNKKIKRDRIKQAFLLTQQYGIMPRAYFIYGSPGETWETINETIKLIKDIRPLSIIFYILDIFPGTELYTTLKEKLDFTDDIWLDRVEDLMYFEFDPQLSPDLIMEFGNRLRNEFYRNLSGFVDSIQLVEKKDLHEEHADFCSRLGMTFAYGDYAGVEEIKNKDKIAEKLFRKSLGYYHDHRAYLGLGILKQKMHEFESSIEVLQEGLKHFPESEMLNICLGVSCMNLGAFEKALRIFSRFPESKDANIYMEKCREALSQKTS
ncbi:radical SAM protein [Thermodesulfobacteriota bacterium]